MSFLKRIGSRSKSAMDLPGDTIRNQEKEEKKEKRSSVHGLSGFRSRSHSSSGDTPLPEDDRPSTSSSAADKDRQRKKYKDTSGIVTPATGPANEYPTFLVHYLGRMPTNSEYGREAVEGPVEQLCKLREKQKLSRVMINFNPDGLRCWEVTGPFLKIKKDGFNMSVPLHNITYGIGCDNHPNIFACIIRMNADPAPGEDQMFILHGFLCAKPEVTQKLTYWQLQAYIEAYEDLKRKRILRERRRKAMEGPSGETSAYPSFTPVAEEPLKDPGKEITEVKIKGKGKVRVKGNADINANKESVKNGPSKAIGLVLQDGAQVQPSNNTGPIEDNPEDVFVCPPGATTGTMVQRARIISRPKIGSSTSDDGGNCFTQAPTNGSKSRSREGSLSSGEGELKKDSSFRKRIGDIEQFMGMDADMLKKLLITEHPTLAR